VFFVSTFFFQVQLTIMSSFSDAAYLSTVFEYLSLMEIASLGRVNQYWNYVSRVCPRSVLDTVGLHMSTEQLLAMVLANRRNLTKIRLSSFHIEQLADGLLNILNQLPHLEHIELLEANRDGSVLFNGQALSEVSKYEIPGKKSLVLSCDPNIPSVKRLLNSLAPNLSTIAFLRGCESIFETEKQLMDFFENSCNFSLLSCVYLGTCNTAVEMDPVIALLLTNAENLRYIQWSNASASLEMMKALMQKEKKIHCAFEGAGFLSYFYGMV
jgi:hypothetical protein